ncbi:glycosyl transferase group 1 [Ancylobacter novellus DSM 506]|uniref:Glycosyl transferase group 1 n=1 Tax=Ancylobacter novellus (strain ATCC 8093 / DSM 506 / JCM 20403 / CCM 1077 / IAM 12100 / NBRC 12443 / NCIMB 10456) TaxID=639283 RepID=D6ZYS0_ANCN5|nr:glycosyltransferase [Ancylobacter novellus]ADH91039.1 glycosyl transferase group 1 [Ancylobacter novellus DSM 506]
MRIVIDLQGAQGDNCRRGIGRYSLELALGIARHRGEHEVLIALNGHFRDTIEDIRAAFDGVLPREAIRVWTAPGPLAWHETANERRRQDAELLREAFLASLEPDAVLVTSLFEGLGDDVVTSVGRLVPLPTAVVLYDLIPLLNEKVYLANDVVRAWYHEKLGHLRRADQLLSISQSAAEEAVTALGWDRQRVANISTAAGTQFRQAAVSPQDRELLRQGYSLSRDYLMYTGGIDPRKNIEGLIRAFAHLPGPVRQAHQLAIVCKASAHDRKRLTALAASVGLPESSLVMTGFVPDEDLAVLYNGCKAFVFPSLHEGFGLPALEAMQCGRAVIASNTSSLPEVVGCDEALFDPRDEADIAAKIERVLTDDAYRVRLEAHGLSQARHFNWDATAIRAIEALEASFGTRGQPLPDASPGKPRLAFISPLPPERSGIADYSADLLPALAEHYEIEVVVSQDDVSDPWIVENLPVRNVGWFRRNAGRFDRILYHFGNSPFHEHMFELLETIPGVLVLHDFFLSGIQMYRGMNNWMQSVLHSHGVEGLAALARPDSEEHGVWTFPGNLSVLQNAAGIIVHSEWSKRLAEQWYGADAARDWAVVPLLRRSADGDDAARLEARRQLGLADDQLVICSFGDVTPNKLTVELVEAFASAVAKLGPRAKLVLVGRAGEAYSHRVEQLSRTFGLKNQVEVTGWVDADTYHRYQQAADIAVQLRTMSRGETSAAALDCMRHGLPLIANANGAMAELDADAVWLIPDQFEIPDLAKALVRLAEAPDLRQRLGAAARALIADRHAPPRAARMYRDAIEAFNTPLRRAVLGLTDRLAPSRPEAGHDRALASALASSFPPRPRRPSLFIDVSYIAELDARTGIQRVTRAIVQALLSRSHASFSVVPVRRAAEGQYVVALRFSETLGCIAKTSLPEEPIDAFPGDVFLGLDLDAFRDEFAQAEVDRMRAMGVKVVHVVYDLLPVRMPQHFNSDTRWFVKWLSMVASLDGAICISRAVADDLAAWMVESGPARKVPLEIGWFHLGADVTNSAPTRGLPADAEDVLARLKRCPTFLAVGTVEPRKGYGQTLAAFEALWAKGIDVNLVIVGKPGWTMGDLIDRLRRHPELGRRLFWPDEVSDEYLERLYAASSCLIAASEGEGFGLPLIEAAQHKLPILARGLPVFREIAGVHAAYFDGEAPEALAQAIELWLAAFREGRHVRSDAMPWLTWQDSAGQLLRAVGVEVESAPQTACQSAFSKR